jgi:hypothetical protein
LKKKWPEMQAKDELFSALRTQMDRAKQDVDRALVLETKSIDGAGKLTKRIRAELKFLNGVC